MKFHRYGGPLAAPSALHRCAGAPHERMTTGAALARADGAREQRIEWDRLGLVGSTLIGVIVGIAMVAGITPMPGDAWFYWNASPGVYAVSSYVYPPILAQLLVPLHWFDAWQLFTVSWITLCFASLGYVLGRWAFVAMALAIPGTFIAWLKPATEPIGVVLMGNVTLPMVAAMVAAQRHPGLWSVPILTKITPGVGLLWFAFRREWRSLAIGIGITLAIVAVSFALAPDAWVAFIQFAVENVGTDVNGPQSWGRRSGCDFPPPPGSWRGAPARIAPASSRSLGPSRSSVSTAGARSFPSQSVRSRRHEEPRRRPKAPPGADRGDARLGPPQTHIRACANVPRQERSSGIARLGGRQGALRDREAYSGRSAPLTA
jgi:Glycosyltransferase family 87